MQEGGGRCITLERKDSIAHIYLSVRGIDLLCINCLSSLDGYIQQSVVTVDKQGRAYRYNLSIPPMAITSQKNERATIGSLPCLLYPLQCVL